MTGRGVAALLLCPLALLTSFVAWGLVLIVRGTPSEELGATLQGAPTIPVVVGFGLALVVIRKFARQDGFSLATLGWAMPKRADLGVAALVGVPFVALNSWYLFPRLAELDPSFDPQLSAISLPAAIVTFAVSVIAEETIYRGYALEVFRTRRSVPVVIAVTSVGYAVLAPGTNLAPKAWALLFGVLLAALRLWRGSLWPGALIHLAASLTPKLLSAF
jgi:membrane protease YdiL (CAAX protease family)